MGNQYGQAGKSTRYTAKRKRGHAVIYFFIALIVILTGWFFLENSKILGLSGIAVLIILGIVMAAPRILDRELRKNKKVERQYNQGARGEEQVGELLLQLSNDFVVMHDVVSPNGNIDHIVYDKRGNIFMLETKSHYGRVTAQGDQLRRDGHTFEKDVIKQSLANSFWLKEKIETQLKVKAWITPVLVFTNAFVTFDKPIKGVYYTNKKYLLQFLQRTNASSPAGLKLWEMRKNYFVSRINMKNALWMFKRKSFVQLSDIWKLIPNIDKLSY